MGNTDIDMKAPRSNLGLVIHLLVSGHYSEQHTNMLVLTPDLNGFSLALYAYKLCSSAPRYSRLLWCTIHVLFGLLHAVIVPVLTAVFYM